MLCPFCKSEIKDSSKFCPKCGEKIELNRYNIEKIIAKYNIEEIIAKVLIVAISICMISSIFNQ